MRSGLRVFRNTIAKKLKIAHLPKLAYLMGLKVLRSVFHRKEDSGVDGCEGEPVPLSLRWKRREVFSRGVFFR